MLLRSDLDVGVAASLVPSSSLRLLLAVGGLWLGAVAIGCSDADPAVPTPTPDPPAPTTGAIRVSVATEGQRLDRDGYMATVDGGASQPVASTGTVTFEGVEPGSHTVDISGFAPNCPAPAASSQTVAVSAGATAEVSLAVVCGYLAYTANVISMDVTVVETATFGVVTSIPLATRPLRVAATPDGSTIYVSNAPVLTAIDTETNAIVGEVTLENPMAVVVSPDGSEVYVTDSMRDEVTVVATSDNTVLATIAVEAGSHTEAPVFSAGGAFAYIANRSANTITVIDTDTHSVVEHIAVGASPSWLTPAPDGSRLYSVNAGSLSIVDLGTNAVVGTVPLGPAPAGEAVVTLDGASVYVLDLVLEEVWVIETASFGVVAKIPVGAGALRMALSPSGEHIYLVDRVNQEVTVIDTTTRVVIENVSLAATPATVTFTEDGALALTANFASNSVSVLNAFDHSLAAAVPVGEGPVWLAITPTSSP